MKKAKWILTILAALLFTGCDDEVQSVGSLSVGDRMPTGDAPDLMVCMCLIGADVGTPQRFPPDGLDQQGASAIRPTPSTIVTSDGSIASSWSMAAYGELNATFLMRGPDRRPAGLRRSSAARTCPDRPIRRVRQSVDRRRKETQNATSGFDCGSCCSGRIVDECVRNPAPGYSRADKGGRPIPSRRRAGCAWKADRGVGMPGRDDPDVPLNAPPQMRRGS